MPTRGAAAARRKQADDDDDPDDPTEDYHDDDNDDDEEDEEEDEAEFVPGQEDDEEDEEEEEEEIHVLDGTLTMEKDDSSPKICYHGQGFHFVTTESVAWNLLDRTVQPPEEISCTTLEMTEECDIEPRSSNNSKDNNKATTPRRIQVTWTKHDGPMPPPPLALQSHHHRHDEQQNGDQKRPAQRTFSNHNEDDDDGKQPSFHYQVYGRQVDAEDSNNNGGEILEFKGCYHPGDGKSVALLCQARMITVSKPATAVAAATAAAAGHKDEGEDDDDEDDADENVDYDELIALHEDAGLSVDALRKRYRDNGDTTGAPAVTEAASAGAADASGKPAKKGKSSQDDDDDEYGF